MSKPFESNNKLREYPDNDGPYRSLTIRPHWNMRDRVVLSVNGEDVGVYLADEIKRAVDNCTNAHRY